MLGIKPAMLEVTVTLNANLFSSIFQRILIRFFILSSGKRFKGSGSKPNVNAATLAIIYTQPHSSVSFCFVGFFF